jgi:Icc-related predicted phosphoesterase
MRIVCISDTHSLHKKMEDYGTLPKGDVLIHAGDCTNVGKPHEVKEFVEWFMGIEGFDTKIFIAGNHDFAFEQHRYPHHKGEYDWYFNLINEENLSQSNVTYLEDSQLVIESPEFSRPIKFWGSPWQPEFYNWAFNLPRLGDELKKYWSMIPDDTDVLITHGPPNEARDFVSNWRQGDVNVGCELLRYRVDEINPLVHVFGHIHGAYGAAHIKDTLFVNASTCNDRYVPSNKPLVVELTEYDGEIVANYVEE